MECWEDEDSDIDTGVGRIHDLMDNMETREDEEDVQLTDQGLEESDDDRTSLSSSIVSGPSLLDLDLPSPEESGTCQTCWKLYLKARKTTRRIKDPLRDNDPQSLTCDEWVLLKKWKPSRRVNIRRKLPIKLQLGKPLHVQEEDSPGCSRQHPFLQRNIRRMKLLQTKKLKKRINRKKRTRSDSQVFRSAKLQRPWLRNNQDMGTRRDVDAVPVNCEIMEDKEDQHLTVELIPVLTISGTDSSCEDPPQQIAPKRRSFRERLAQLKSSSIFRETY